jgi:hypothetical protein
MPSSRALVRDECMIAGPDPSLCPAPKLDLILLEVDLTFDLPYDERRKNRL